jgi:hypothetical protein
MTLDFAQGLTPAPVREDPRQEKVMSLQTETSVAGTPSGEMLPSAAMAELIERSSHGPMTIGGLLEQSPPSARETFVLLIALIALVPGASLPAGVALMLLAVPVVSGGQVWLPKRLAERPLPTQSLAHMFHRVLPILRWQERVFGHGRAGHIAATRPFAAALILLLSATLLVPLPLSNVAPALAIAMIAVAYLEASVTLLLVSALSGVLSLALTGSVVWAALGGARSLFG